MDLDRFMKRTDGILLFFLLLAFIAKPSVAMGRNVGSMFDNPHPAVILHEAELSNILSVLNHKIGDPGLLEKAKRKLFTLNERQLVLIASLSERIAKGGDTAGADLGFLLITALIILS